MGAFSRASTWALALLSGAALVGWYVMSPPEAQGLIHPLGSDGKKFRISSPFGPRVDPLTGLPAGHAGIDFAVPIGTPVYAVAPGRIYEVGRDPGDPNGLCVKLRFDGYRFKYLHLSRILVSVGQEVERGTQIGESGNTGRSTGPHLHYEIADDLTNIPVNPVSVHSPGTFA